MSALASQPPTLPALRTDTAAAAQAVLANRAYAALLTSGTAVTTSQYVAALGERGIGSEAARARIKRDRARGHFITLSHEGESIIPTFQLREDFDHSPAAADVVAVLLGAGYGPWDIWDWVEAPNPWIGRRRPADAIRADDAGVVGRALDALVGEGPEA